MGNPVSVSIADIYLEHLEQNILTNCPIAFKPLFYRMYIDDVFLIFDVPYTLTMFMISLKILEFVLLQSWNIPVIYHFWIFLYTGQMLVLSCQFIVRKHIRIDIFHPFHLYPPSIGSFKKY